MREYINRDDIVLYVQCPYCKAGWFGKVKYYEFEFLKNEDGSTNNTVDGPFGNMYLTAYVVEGMQDVDVTKDVTCLNCGKSYKAIDSAEGVVSENTMLMYDFVAKAVTTVKNS